MKQIITILSFFLCLSVNCQASEIIESEPESTVPMHGTEIERHCSLMDIEGKLYSDVKVTLKANNPSSVIYNTYKVKVRVENSEGKVVYKKTFSNAYLYIFSSGQIQVGNKNFTKLVIVKSSDGRSWLGEIKEKEGIWE